MVVRLLFKTLNFVMEKLLEEIYYDPSQPGSFGGVESIYRAAVERGRKIPRRKIQEWLRKQDTCTLHKPARFDIQETESLSGE